MICSKQFYDQCCPSYKKVINEFDKEILEIQKQSIPKKEQLQQIYTAIMQFSDNYLTPNEYWEYFMELINKRFYNSKEFFSYEEWKILCCGIAKRAKFHLYYNREEWNDLYFPVDNGSYENDPLNAYGDINLMLTDYQNRYALLFDETYIADENDFDYPHSCLKESFRRFEHQSSRLPPKKLEKKCKEMKALYLKIKAVEDDDVDAWFILLLEANNESFIKDNAEFRLGKNLLHVKLWKIYISFLKERGHYKWLLEFYSKYCRFFLDDHAMLEEYKQAMIQYGPVNLEWNNLFKFGAKKVKEDNNYEMQNAADELKKKDDALEVIPFDRSLCVTFYDTYQVQNFSLSAPLILYCLDTANHRVLRKLFSSCKYFFTKKPTPICYNFYTGSKEEYNNENLTIQHSSNLDLFVKNTYITGSISVEHSAYGDNFMSNIIPRLSCCEAKYICLDTQNLSFNELKFLIKQKSVVNLKISKCHVKDENGEFVDLEEIMKYLPNIEKLHLPEVRINANTASALKKQSFIGKICNFYINSVYGEPFDLNEFLEYCDTNRDERFNLCWYFNKEFGDVAFVEKFKEIVKDYKKSCKNTKTSIFVSLNTS